MLGEFLGLHNLNQILEYFHIKSHDLYNTWRKFTYEQVVFIAESFFWINFRSKMIELCSKSESTWSRANVTVVIDSSIYKLILSKAEKDEEYDIFFSGQSHSVVYGFRLTLIGIVIERKFYPIRFYISSKKEKEIEVAKKLLKEVEKKIEQLKKEENIDFPNLFCSVDSGFCQKSLFDAVDTIDVISVPKRSWLFEIDGKKQSLKKHIEEYEAKERNHKKSVFPLRKRAVGNTLGEVVLLFFRYEGQEEISVIVTTKLDILAKTLRHRWFQRTYIEQFFRFSKHTLKVQEIKSTDKQEFEKKISINFLKAVECRKFTDFSNDTYKILKEWSFEKIRKNLINEHIEPLLLKKALFTYDDLLHKSKS